MEKGTELVPYSLDAVKVEELKAKYSGVTILPEDKNAYKMVMGGLKECREIRLAVDEWHKAKKAWIVKAGKHYDQEKNRVHALIAPIEDHLKAVRKVEDDRVAAIQAEKVNREMARVAGIRAKIDAMSMAQVINAPFKTSADVAAKMTDICDVFVSPEGFAEFTEEATRVKSETIAALTDIYEDRKRIEEESERLAKQKAEQDAIRQAQEAEAKRLDDLRKAEEEKARKEREAIEAEKRRLQEEKDRAEFERKAREKAEADAKAKVEREAKEKADREAKEAAKKAAKEARRPDKEKILAYANAVLSVPRPEIKDPFIQKVLENFSTNIGVIATTLKAQMEGM